MAPHRNHVEARSSRAPARQYVAESHDHKADAPSRAESRSAAKHTESYEVTRDGRVYSIANWRGINRRELTQDLNSHGYPLVRMHIEGKRVRKLVHRLVAEKFLPSRPTARHQIRHLDGNKTNNAAENLAWGTAKENAADRERHGHTSRGAGHSAAIKASNQAEGTRAYRRLQKEAANVG